MAQGGIDGTPAKLAADGYEQIQAVLSSTKQQLSSATDVVESLLKTRPTSVLQRGEVIGRFAVVLSFAEYTAFFAGLVLHIGSPGTRTEGCNHLPPSIIVTDGLEEVG